MTLPSSTQQDLVKKLFWSSAEEDYICARLSAQNGLYRHFTWNAGQCLEKYIKYIVLLRGEPAKFGHEFYEPFKEYIYNPIKQNFPSVLDVSSFTKVREGNEQYAQEDLLHCIRRFEKLGSPSGRHRTVNNKIWPYDLQKLDRLVFLLRRLGVVPPSDQISLSEHTRKLEQDHYYTCAHHWDSLHVGPFRRQKKLSALKFENCANFPEMYNESKGWYFLVSDIAPQIALDIAGRISPEDSTWLEQNVKMPKWRS